MAVPCEEDGLFPWRKRLSRDPADCARDAVADGPGKIRLEKKTFSDN